MYFDADELAYAEMLAGEVGMDEFTQMCKEEVGRGGDSTPLVSGFKVGSGTPQRRRLFDDSVQNLTPLDLGRPGLGFGKAFDLGGGWREAAASVGTFAFVAGDKEKAKHGERLAKSRQRNRADERLVEWQEDQIGKVVKRVLAEQRREDEYYEDRRVWNLWVGVVEVFGLVQSARMSGERVAMMSVMVGFIRTGRRVQAELQEVAHRQVVTQEMGVQVDGESKRRKKKRIKGVWIRILMQVQVCKSREWQQRAVTSVCVASKCFVYMSSVRGVRRHGVDAEVQVGTKAQVTEQAVQVGGGGPRISRGPDNLVKQQVGRDAQRQVGTEDRGVLEANRGGCRVEVQDEESVEVRGELQAAVRRQESSEEAEGQLLAKLRELFVNNRAPETQVDARNTMEERMRDWPDYLPPIGR